MAVPVRPASAGGWKMGSPPVRLWLRTAAGGNVVAQRLGAYSLRLRTRVRGGPFLVLIESVDLRHCVAPRDVHERLAADRGAHLQDVPYGWSARDHRAGR